MENIVFFWYIVGPSGIFLSVWAWSLIRNQKMLSLRNLLCNCEVRDHCMCKEMPVIRVWQGGGQEKNNWKKWMAEEEERHKGSPPPPAGPPPPANSNFGKLCQETSGNPDRHCSKQLITPAGFGGRLRLHQTDCLVAIDEHLGPILWNRFGQSLCKD
jgi:hypothetical protein